MTDTCHRCNKRYNIGSLVYLTDGWGGRRSVLVCLDCKQDGETFDSASD